jgi:hypothetical protein
MASHHTGLADPQTAAQTFILTEIFITIKTKNYSKIYKKKSVYVRQCQTFAATSSRVDYLCDDGVGEVADRSRRKEPISWVQETGDMNFTDLGDTNKPTVFLS